MLSFSKVGRSWAIAALGAVALAMPAFAIPWQVDAVHSSVFFKVKHLGTSWAYGLFHEPTGTVNFDPAKPTEASLSITLNTAKVDTGNAKRDEHLRSNDYFAAKQFPTITFKSTSFKATSEPNTFEVAGDLTLRGVTKPVTVKLVLTGTGKNFQQADIAGFETTFTIKRSDFGMTESLGAIADEVTLSVSLEVIKQ